MAFCNNCGNQLGTNQTFCPECGEKHEGANLVTEKTRTGQSRGFFSKKVKIGLVAAVVLAIGLFVTHQILSHRYAPENVIENFEKAVTEGDEKALLELLHPSTKSLELDEESVAGFTSYLENKSDIDEIVKGLYEQAINIENYKKTEALTDQNGNEILTLKRGEKKFGLYPQYEVQVIPFKVEMTSNLENVELTFHDKKKTVESPGEYVDFGEFLPGTGKVKAVYKGEYVTLKDEFDLPFSEEVSSDNLVRFHVDLEGEYVSIFSNEYNATLFVNGKSTGKTINEIDEFGPIDTNGKVVLHAEYTTEKGTIKTEKVEVSDQGEVDLNFKEEELYWEDSMLVAQETSADELEADMNGLVEVFMNNYINYSVQALNERDFGIISGLIDPEGPTYNETKEYLEYIESEGITEELTSVTVRGFEQQEHGVSVKTEESYNIYYGDGTGKAKTFHSEYFLIQEGSVLKAHTLLKTEEIHSEDL